MAYETISPNMGLPVPGVGQTSGPQWATDVNSSLNIVDAHDHTSNNGVQITPLAININADLTFASYSATNLATAQFSIQPSFPTSLGSLYVKGVDLYFNDESGNNIRITQSGGIAGSPGSIANLTSPASASYVALSGKFVWQQDSNVAASLDFQSAIFRNTGASSFGLTVRAPAGMAADYTITLPALPASQKIMAMGNDGSITAPFTVDNSTIEIASTVIQVKNSGITNSKILDATITGTKLVDATVTGGKIAASTITGTNIDTSINLPGSTTSIDGHVPFVSNVASTSTPYTIAFGSFNASFNGSGALTAANAAGTTAGVEVSSITSTRINFQISPAMSGTPAVSIGIGLASGTLVSNMYYISGLNGSGFEFNVPATNPSATIIYHIHVTGVRA